MRTLIRFFSYVSFSLALLTGGAQARSNPGDLDQKSMEFLKVLGEGAEGEKLVDLWVRVQPYLSPALRAQLAPILANQENAPSASLKVQGNTFTVVEDVYTLVAVVEKKGDQNVVTINGNVLAKSDFGSAASLKKKLDGILRDEVKKKKRASAFWPVTLLMPEANAFLSDTMLLTTLAGTAIGYGWGGNMQSAMMGAGIGLLGGLVLDKMTQPQCTPVSYWNGYSCAAACVQSGSGFPSTCQVPGATQYAAAAPQRIIYDATPVYKGQGLRSTSTPLGTPATAADKPRGSAK